MIFPMLELVDHIPYFNIIPKLGQVDENLQMFHSQDLLILAIPIYKITVDCAAP